MAKAERIPWRASVRRLQLPISERRALIVVGDVLMVLLATLLALRVWALRANYTFDLGFVLPQVKWFFALGVLWLILAAANDFYNLSLTANWRRSARRLLQITLQTLVVYLVIFFLSPRDALPRLFILYYAVISTLLIIFWRAWRPFLSGWTGFKRRALVVGAGWAGETIIEAIQTYIADDYELIGVVDEGDAPDGGLTAGLAALGGGPELSELARQRRIHEVILATGQNIEGALFQAVMDCYELGIPVTPMPLLFEQITGRVPVEHVRGHWSVVLPLEGRSVFDPYPPLKRLLDVCLAIVGLIPFGLTLPLLAALIVVDSPGPLFFAQERVGKAGQPFRLFKLRTMIPDAERDSGPLWAVRGDPRVTRVGRFLRKTRLDEVPQLLNVLAGHMSLVGPRPERPAFVADLQERIPFYRARLSVRPGVTGWAQVNYGYGSTVEDALMKLQYDLYYIRHRSLLLDGLVLLKTLGQVLALRGM